MAREGAPASRFIPQTTVFGKPEACELDARAHPKRYVAKLSMRNQNVCVVRREIEMRKKSRPRRVGFVEHRIDRLTSWPEPEQVPVPEPPEPLYRPAWPHQPPELPQAWGLLSSGRPRRPSAPAEQRTEQSTFS